MAGSSTAVSVGRRERYIVSFVLGIGHRAFDQAERHNIYGWLCRSLTRALDFGVINGSQLLIVILSLGFP